MGIIKTLVRWLFVASFVGAVALAVLVLTGVVALPGATARSEAKTGQPKSPAEPVAVVITTAPATPRPVQRTVQIVGTFYGHDEVTITPKVEGRVSKILHDVGDVVKPGDVLLEVEDIDHRLAVHEAERAVELELAKLGLKELPREDFDWSSLPTVVRASAQEKNAATKKDRARRIGAGVSSEDREQMESDFRVAQATREQMLMEAQATLASARHKQALLETAKLKLAETKVRVPDLSAGRLADIPRHAAVKDKPVVEYVIAQRMASEGEMVRAFPSVAVYRLVMDRPLKLMATVPERYVGDVKVGQAVTIRVEPYPNEEFRGAVSRVNPTVDRGSRTFQIEVLVPNEDRKLKAGSFAKAAIATREESAAVTVPEEALVMFAGVTKVFVVENGKSKPVPVKPGQRLEVPTGEKTGHWFEVTGDLKPGNPVVTSGHSQLAEGTPVRQRTPDETK